MTAAWYPVRRVGLKWQKAVQPVVWLLPLLLCGCGGKRLQTPDITVTIEPQRYFAEKIAGGYFSVHTIVPPGQSPETYDPAPHEMVRIAQSRAYLQIGRIGFEQAWAGSIRANNPQVTFFDLSEGVEWIENETGDAHEHEHGHHHGHHHGHFDPHIWTSTVNAEIIARNVLQAFILLDGAHETAYRDNYRLLIDDIDATERLLHEMLDTLSCRTFVIYHPALTYFADEFGLVQLAIETDGKEPSALSMKTLVDRAKAAGVKVVFVQQEFDRKHAEQLAAEINARIVEINPLDKHWREQLVLIAEALCADKA
ncbi:MAG: zinc ABC transporter substrate-binding protein [Tannerella sp.]|nr:zinc ABC transporter substrate-binding protein [Tannerella sp.]